MIAEFLLTPFLIAWPCPGLYGKSALAVEKEVKSQVWESSVPLIPNNCIPIFSHNSSHFLFSPLRSPFQMEPPCYRVPWDSWPPTPALLFSFAWGPDKHCTWFGGTWENQKLPERLLQFHWQTSLCITIRFLRFVWNLLLSIFYPTPNWSLDILIDELFIALCFSLKSNHFFTLIFYMALIIHWTF